MIITIKNKTKPAQLLSYLLHKNPSRPQTFELSFGCCHVFYPIVNEDECEVALILDLNPLDLSRGKETSVEGGLFDYVNDRQYVTSSFMSTAISKVFGSAIVGKAKEYKEMVNQKLDLEAKICMIKCNSGESFIRRLFEPLGYNVEIENFNLSNKFSHFGESKYFNITIKNNIILKELLQQLYILIPVLDIDKHYYVGDDEVDKLIRMGDNWLQNHTESNLIIRRYLKNKRSLINKYVKNNDKKIELTETDNNIEEKKDDELIQQNIKNESLNEKRLNTIYNILKEKNIKKVLDLGCSSGKLIKMLAKDNSFTKITGVDVSYNIIERLKEKQTDNGNVEIFQGSVVYRDERFKNFDAIVLMEVIEHIDETKIDALEYVVFKYSSPKYVIVTTPDISYNINYEGLGEGKLRHNDHRFEWNRVQFENWCNKIKDKYLYDYEFFGIGDIDVNSVYPTQGAIFCIDNNINTKGGGDL